MSDLGPALYVDASALVKLVKTEPETADLSELVTASELHLTSSEIVEVELLRAVRRHEPALLRRAWEILDGLIMIPFTGSIRARARSIDPASVRSLDAIHVATAIEIRPHLNSLLTYDERMIEAASSCGIPVTRP
ncbi:MAG: type II toxin-antitoxin system VapC family toxin [Solirubrobacterales bacterium]|nr:type II toxin-antitoxin system VapC family toxin [Solirubrobacterales bacterium]